MEIDKNGSNYTVKFPINLYTWGSIMNIKIIDDSQFNVEIHPKLPTQIFDWGDGKRKIDKLVSTIKEIQ